jgi:hypothetical protein
MKPRTLAGPSAAGPKSAAKDEIDPFMKKDDPIGITCELRESKGGSKAGTVPNPKSLTGKFFFNIKLKGEMPEPAKKPNHVEK